MISVERYVSVTSQTIEGWLSNESVVLVRAAATAQGDLPGSVGEIGVHHGKLFILLCLLAPRSRYFAIDVFEAQELNVDGSGRGDREVFERNLRRCGIEASAVDIISSSSTDVTAEELSEISGPVRLFSVDGGHTTNIVLSDLLLAEAVLADGGIVILDDAFNSSWPGVAAALGRYLLGEGRLVPFAVSPEKVLLTQPRFQHQYCEAVRTGVGTLFDRQEDFYGSPVSIVSRSPGAGARFRQAVADTGVYQRARRSRLVGATIEKARPVVLRVLRAD